MIEKGETVLEIERYKIPDYEIECAIYGEDGEIPRASKYHCEECGGLFLSLSEIGFCVDPFCDQKENLKEYQAHVAFVKGESK